MEAAGAGGAPSRRDPRTMKHREAEKRHREVRGRGREWTGWRRVALFPLLLAPLPVSLTCAHTHARAEYGPGAARWSSSLSAAVDLLLVLLTPLLMTRRVIDAH